MKTMGMMLPSKELQAYREEFPILQQRTYLNSCSCGALSRRVRQAMIEGFLASWDQRGGRAWYGAGGWLDVINQVRVKLAELIGAFPEEIALTANVSSALGSLGSALTYQGRRKIVCTELDFPTLTYQWLARQPETELCQVKSPDGLSIPLESIARVTDQATMLVATSRVCYSSGAVQDIETLAEIAHRNDAYLLIDDYQGTGQVPINVHASNIDFLVGGTQKWLLGGPGIGFLYIRKVLLDELYPRQVGWFGHKQQLAFAPVWTPRTDAARFELGTPSVGAFYAANAALDLILAVGVERIHQHNTLLVQDLIERGQDVDLCLHLPEQSSAIVQIVPPISEQPSRLVEQLADRGIILDSRGPALRCSPHFYNTLEDNQCLITALKEVQRAW